MSLDCQKIEIKKLPFYASDITNFTSAVCAVVTDMSGEPLFQSWAYSYSANYDYAYNTIISGGEIGGNLNINGEILSSGINLFDIFLTSETDSQTLSFNDVTAELTISNGNTVSLSALSGTKENFVHIEGDVMTGGLSAPSISADVLYVGASTINFFDSFGNVIETLKSNDVTDFKSNYTTTNLYSSEWNESYTNLISNSAAYLTGTDLTLVQENSGNWQSVYTEFNSQSANNSSVYNTVNSNSATNWNYQGTDIKELTGNWENTYTSFNVQSSNNDSVYSTVNYNSGNWQTAYTTINTSSASWGIGAGLTLFKEISSTTSPNNLVSVHALAVSSASANVDFAIISKGTGALLAQIPDGTSSGGDKRGYNAVDWQMNRSNSQHVAHGDYSVIGGGYSNTVQGNFSNIGGGYANTVSNYYSNIGGGYGSFSSGYFSFIGGGIGNNSIGDNSVIGGGNGNSIYSDYSNILGGKNNTASGSYSNILGGFKNTASGFFTNINGGQYALADRFGMESRASNYFEDFGDAQRVEFVLYGLSTNTVSSYMTLDNYSVYLTLQPYSGLLGTIQILGSDNEFNFSQIVKKFLLVRDYDDSYILKHIETIGNDTYDAGNVSVNADNNGLSVTVGSNSNLTTKWVASIYGIEIRVAPSTPPNSVTVYSDCSYTTPIQLFMSEGLLPNSVGDYIYYNRSLTNPYNNTSYVYNGSYYNTDNDGLISYASDCP